MNSAAINTKGEEHYEVRLLRNETEHSTSH